MQNIKVRIIVCLSTTPSSVFQILLLPLHYIDLTSLLILSFCCFLVSSYLITTSLAIKWKENVLEHHVQRFIKCKNLYFI